MDASKLQPVSLQNVFTVPIFSQPKTNIMLKSACLLTTLVLLLNTITFSQAGTLDSTFSKDGVVEEQYAGGQKWQESSKAHSVAIQADARIVVAGDRWNGTEYDIGLARYQPGGIRDTSFGLSGQTVTDLGNSDEAANAVAIQSDGKIVVAGYRYDKKNDRTDFLVVRYNEDGKRDGRFGENGVATTTFGLDNSAANAIAMQSNGKIVVAGSAFIGAGNNNYFALARYKQDGTPDSSFGSDGKVTTDFGVDAVACSVAIELDGKIVVAGYSGGFQPNDFTMTRYKSNGTLDSSFGANGKVFTDFGGPEQGRSLAIQADGKILLAGNAINDFGLARYKPNGSLDSAFGINGKVVTDLGNDWSEEASSVALQADGKIVVAGTSYSKFAVVRYLRNGQLDNSFGRKGKVLTDVGHGGAACQSLALQPDGKIVTAGYKGYKYAIIRYDGDPPLVSKADSKDAFYLPAIQLSPNPVKDILRVERLSSSTKTISVFDVKGNLVQRIITSNDNYTFNTKQFSAGIYFVKVVEADKAITLKFVKQ